MFFLVYGFILVGPGDKISETAHERFNAIQLPELSYVTRFFLFSRWLSYLSFFLGVLKFPDEVPWYQGAY